MAHQNRSLNDVMPLMFFYMLMIELFTQYVFDIFQVSEETIHL